MKKKFTALVVAAAAVMGTTLTSGVATASTAPTTQAAEVGTAAAWKVKAQQTLTVRAKRTTKSAAVGTMPKGTVITTDDLDGVPGSRYKVCGTTDTNWYPVKWHGAKGWVVAACWFAV
ncbi:hypothetical protein ACFYYR_03325 [Streptomyces sp. NPDC001922]|uniref:SH3 domain-containing protein n=1 Tax=unclassified Streptomyces TaxID=2593676 RepID=UPI00331DE594